MLSLYKSNSNLSSRMGCFVRLISTTQKNQAKRFIQTAQAQTNKSDYVPYKTVGAQQTSGKAELLEKTALELKSLAQSKASPRSFSTTTTTTSPASSWARHTLSSGRSFKDILNTSKKPASQENELMSSASAPAASAPAPAASEKTQPQVRKRARRALKPRKALITLSPSAILHLRNLLNQPTPQLIRIGVRNRGCSGLTYNLEYIEKPSKFDEIIEQDGVKLVIDSKALFSIVGSEMDWLDDKLSSKFVFKNPNSKGTCGCGESFMV